MREAGSGSVWMSPRRSFPRARRTERRQRSMSGRGSAGGRGESEDRLAQLGTARERTTLTTAVVAEL